MQYSHDDDVLACASVEDDVLAVLLSPQPRPDRVARAAEDRVICEALTGIFELIEVTNTLLFAPGVLCVARDLQQIRLGS